MAFNAHLLVPPGTHDLSKAGGVVPVGLVRHHAQRCARVPRVEANYRQPTLGQLVPQPDREWPGLHPELRERKRLLAQPRRDCVRAGDDLALNQLATDLVDNADRGLLQGQSSAAYWFMAV